MTIEGKRYVDEDVRITDLFADADVLTGYTFRDCRIVGPAVILIEGEAMLDGNRFDVDGEPLGMLWLKPAARKLHGVVTFRSSEFFDCEFRRIGLASTKDVLDRFLSSGD